MSQRDPFDLLVRTVWGEARSEPPEGQQAVSAVVLNRARQSGQSISDVVLAPNQFEPWNNPKTRAEMLALDPGSPEYRAIASNIAATLEGHDPTGGADHFYSPSAQQALGRRAPSWDNGRGVDLGRHRFFKLGYRQRGGGGRTPDGRDIFGFEGSDAMAGGDGFGGDIFGLTPEDLGDGAPSTGGGAPAGPGASQPSSGANIFGLDPNEPDAPQGMPLRPEQLPRMEMGDGSVFDAKTGGKATAAQTAFYRKGMAEGTIDPNTPPDQWGTEHAPLLQRSPDAIPEPGQWYVDLNGVKRQVPGGSATASTDPAWKTAVNLPLLFLAPSVFPALSPGMDTRTEAVLEGGQSGAMLGGSNEFVAGLGATDDFISGGYPKARAAFSEHLADLDRRDAELRELHPGWWGGGAVATSLAASALAAPAQATLRARLGSNAALGAGSGWLSTDGTSGDRAQGALAGGLFGAGLTGAAAGLGRAFKPQVAITEAWTDADEVLKPLGTSLGDLPEAARTEWKGLVERGALPGDAAIMVAGKHLPTPVPMARAHVTGLPTEHLDLNLAHRGARGSQAAAEVQGFVDDQQDALRANVDQITTQLGGGRAVTPGEGGQMVSESLDAMRTAKKSAVDNAYDAARKMDPDRQTVVPRYDAEELSGRMMQEISADMAPRDIPRTAAHIVDLAKLAAQRGKDAPIRSLYEVRARLSSLRAEGGIESAAAGKAVKIFDEFMAEKLADDLIEGDPAVVGQWRTAIRERRELGAIFQQGDLVERLTEKVGSGSGRRLAVDPGDAANFILGANGLGWVGRRNLPRDLAKIRDLIGHDSEAWNAMRAEVFVRLARQGESANNAGVQGFSGVKFNKAWRKLLEENPRLAEVLYSEQERKAISQFGAVAGRVTAPVKGGDNPSNTAVTAMKTLRSFSGSLGKMMPFIHQAVEELEKRGAAAAVRKQIQNPKPRQIERPAPGRLPGQVGGFIGSETERPVQPAVPELLPRY